MSAQLQKVKERLSKYKEEIDEAEEREIAANTALIEAESRLEKAQGEVDGVKRRLVLLRVDLEKAKKNVDANGDKLGDAEGRHGNDEDKRQAFEATEIERDEQLFLLEEECVSAKKLGEEAHTVMVESERKMTVLENELQRTLERCAVGDVRVSTLEGNINMCGGEIRTLEDRDNDAAEREQLSEEKMKFLEDQMREVEERAEMGEREVGKMERIAAEVLNEIAGWKKKTKDVTDEVTDIENMADDELLHDAQSSRRHEPEPEPEQEPEPEPEPQPEEEPEPEPASDEEPEED